MASEYLKWKYRDVKPREKAELTPEEKRKNWWHYHKWHVGLGVVLAGAAVSLACSILGVGQVRPDFQVAYVGENALPDDTAAAVEAAFASLGEDLNGDGKVVVRLNQYVSASGTDPGMATAAEVKLMADLMDCESYFFLLEDPEQFQAGYHSLRCLDGSLPEEDDDSAAFLSWDQCPALAGMDLGDYTYQVLGETVSGSSEELVDRLSLARRGFWTEDTCAYPEGCDALWSKLTEGAVG